MRLTRGTGERRHRSSHLAPENLRVSALVQTRPRCLLVDRDTCLNKLYWMAMTGLICL